MSEFIPLRRRDGTIRAFALVDESDVDALSLWRWRLDRYGYAIRTACTVPGRTRAHVGRRDRTISMARVILGLEHGDPREADHINRRRLDNRRANLRIVEKAAQGQNRSSNRGSRSRYRGVSWDRADGRWKAQASFEGRDHTLGRFDTEDEAAAVASAFRAEHMPYSADALEPVS